MNRLAVGDLAPDFILPDYEGTMIRLSDILRDQHVLLVFNVGFA